MPSLQKECVNKRQSTEVSGKFQHCCSVILRELIFYYSSRCSIAGKMSEYQDFLDPPSRKRYNEKTELIENKDPNTLSENEFSGVDFYNFPPISYPDIVSYLVFRPSPYSADDMTYEGI